MSRRCFILSENVRPEKAKQKWFSQHSRLSKEEIIDNYNHLWKIEKAFRIAKTDLKIRPVYHQLQRRIEAHICIAFVAYQSLQGIGKTA